MSLWLTVIAFFLICVTNSDDNGNSSSSSSSFSAADSPPFWCDLAFVGWILLIHIYYSYKFTEYSLNHIQRRLNEIENADYQVETQHNTIRNQTMSTMTASFDSTLPNISSNSLDLNSPSLTINMASPDGLGQELASDPSFRKHSALTLRSGYGMVKKSNTQDSYTGVVSPRTTDDLQQQPASPSSTRKQSSLTGHHQQHHHSKKSEMAHELLETAYADIHNKEIPKSKVDKNTKKNSKKNKKRGKHKRNNSESDSNSSQQSIGSESHSVAEMILHELETVHKMSKIDITVEYATLARPLTGLPNTRCLCILSWSPTLFSWSRTRSIRIFLKIWILISSSLAFVLWMEFFGNALLEV